MSYRVLTLSEENTFSADNYVTAISNYDGVVLRVGYADPADGTMHTDSKFATHYNAFSNSNCKIGVYWETAATTTTEATDEANYVYNIIKNLSSGLMMPVYIWTKQSASDNSGRADNLDEDTLTSVLTTFASTLTTYSYKVGLMATEDWIRTKVVPEVIIPDSADDPDSENYNPTYTYHINLDEWTGYIWVVSLGTVPTLSSYDSWMYSNSTVMTGYDGVITESNFYTNVANWDLQVKELSELTITVSGDTGLVYTTKEHKPTVEVMDTTNTLVENTHYTVEYTNNINVGTATITITGVPEQGYDGTVTKSFTISARDISEDAVLTCGDPDDEQYYNFDNFAVFCDSIRLTEDTDYDLDYSEAIVEHTVEIKTLVVPEVIIPDSADDPDSENYNPTYETTTEDRTDIVATAKVTGKTNYTGTKSAEYNLRAYTYPETRTDITTLTIELAETSYYYSGKQNKPAVNIRNDEYLLVEGKDYKLTYADNIEVGQGKVVITGIYDYTGEYTKVFNIVQTDISGATVTCGTPDSKGSYDLDNLAVVIESMSLTVPSTDYTYTETEETLDKYVISTVTIIAKNNFTGSVTAQFQTNYIKDSDPDGTDINDVECVIEQTNYTYAENTTFKPAIRLYKLNDSSDLVEGTDYQAVYSNNNDAGTANIKIYGIGNYYGNRSVNFIIAPKDLSNADITSGSADSDGVYDLANLEVRVDNYMLSKDIDYYTLSDPQQTNYEIKTTVYVYGQNNYTGMAQKTFKTEQIVVNMKYITVELASDTDEFTYTGSKINPKVLVGFQVPEYVEPPEVIIPGSEWDPDSENYIDHNAYEQTEPILTEGVDYTISYVNSINHGTYYVSVTGIGNYEGTKTVKYKIVPRDITNDSIISCGEPTTDSNGRSVYDINNLMVIIDNKTLTQAVDYEFTADESDIDDAGYPNTKVTVVALNNYTGTKTATFVTDKKSMYPGKTIQLEKATVYPRYGTIKSTMTKTGTFYLWDDKVVNGRIRITNNYLGIKKLGYITGWIDTSLLVEKSGFEIGDAVVVQGMLTQYADGSGNTIAKDNIVMYITDILDTDQFSNPYGVASAINRNRLGWASSSMIKLYDESMILH